MGSRRRSKGVVPPGGVWHIVPVDDLIEHETDGLDCWCKPDYDEWEQLVTHNALDGREAYESGQRKPH